MSEKRVYVAEFKSKVSEETFIKVGVSSYAIEARFANDLKNYTIKLLYETKFYNESGSFIVESNFHNLLKSFKYNPLLRLTSGNTECFVNTEMCLNKIKDILTFRPVNKVYIRKFKKKVDKKAEYLQEMKYKILVNPPASKKEYNNLLNSINELAKEMGRKKFKVVKKPKFI